MNTEKGDGMDRGVSNALSNDRRAMIWDIVLVLLCASWPFIGFINHNYQQTAYLGRVLAIWLLFTVAALILTAVIRQVPWLRLRARAGIAVGICFVWFFSFGAISESLFEVGVRLGTIHLMVWAVGLGIMLTLGLRLSDARKVRLIGLAVVLSMLAVPATQLAGQLIVSQGVALGTAASDDQANMKAGAGKAKLVKASNVYWILPDAYMRADALLGAVGYDNTPFLNALEARGFKVARNSFVNYPATSQSVSTTLNMDYFYPVGEEYPPEIYGFKLQGFNNVVRRFKQHGYRYLHMEAGHLMQKTRCGGVEDICIKGATANRFSLSEADINLLRLTPLYRIISRLLPTALSADLTFVGDAMRALRRTVGNGPQFSFVHILSPHFPNRYQKNCTIMQNIGHELLGDYGDPKFAKGYLFDLICLNGELLAAIDEILAIDEADPIIIVQSDHGVPLGQSEYVNSDPYIAFRNLNAIRFPVDCGKRFHDNVTSVNTFRMVFSCLEGKPMPLVKDRFFRSRQGTMTIEELADLRSQ
jgi:hypothetical protein